jgi:lysophospholipase L1-like esterase
MRNAGSSQDPAEPSVPQPSPPQRSHRRRWLGRIAWTLLAVVLLGLVGGELFARLYLGLGDPPLYVADPQIEYLNKPSMHYRRFGNSVTYNAYSMRSGPITPKKTDPAQLRVLFLGDSIINGGGLTDDSKLATAILQKRLSEALHRDVYVGNASAGSWGPPNELAYLRRFGLFDADVLVLELNSADYGDVPTFEPIVGIAMEYPDHRPLLALQEGFSRYLLPRLHGAAASAPTSAPAVNPDAANAPQEHVQQCQEAITQIVKMARDAGVKVLIYQHPEHNELTGPEWPGHRVIQQTVRDLGIEPIQLAPVFQSAVSKGENPYRDAIHPNDLGQSLIADALFEPIREALPGVTTRPATAN